MDTKSTISSVQNLCEILIDAAARHPTRTAIRARGHSMSYQQLDLLSDRYCSVLIEGGLAQGDRVAVIGHKSPEMVAATQAVLRAGAIYVPIDPRAAPSRVAEIFRDCGITTAIGDHTLVHHTELIRSVRCKAVDVHTPLPPMKDKIRRKATGDQPAYLLYPAHSNTSKDGVMTTHKDGLDFIRWVADHIEMDQNDRILGCSPLNTRLPVLSLYNGFLAGATVVLLSETKTMFPSAVVRTLAEESISSLYMSSANYIRLMKRGGLLESNGTKIRRIMYSGASFPRPQLKRLRRWAPDARVFKLRSPIERKLHTQTKLPQAGEATARLPHNGCNRGLPTIARPLVRHDSPN